MLILGKQSAIQSELLDIMARIDRKEMLEYILELEEGTLFLFE